MVLGILRRFGDLTTPNITDECLICQILKLLMLINASRKKKSTYTNKNMQLPTSSTTCHNFLFDTNKRIDLLWGPGGCENEKEEE